MIRTRKNHESHLSSHTRLYKIWEGMIRRCSAKSQGQEREEYYEKGIRVSKKWRSSFLAFKKWAVRSGYTENLTIDRRDPEKGYNAKNCRWANKSQQLVNARKRENGSSMYKGVSWNSQRNKWMAIIHFYGKRIYLGLYQSEKEAAVVYDQKLTKLYGGFARTNL